MADAVAPAIERAHVVCGGRLRARELALGRRAGHGLLHLHLHWAGAWAGGWPVPSRELDIGWRRARLWGRRGGLGLVWRRVVVSALLGRRVLLLLLLLLLIGRRIC